MPWQEVSIMEQRREFVSLALQEGANRRELCRRFGISAQTGYKWLARASDAEDWASDRSRRPRHSPRRSSESVEGPVLAVRDAHPAWGARKIRAFLERDGLTVPAPSTVHGILVRHDRIVPPGRAVAHCRFEHPAPNLVWQMDYKGRTPMQSGRWCHPLTVIDDHSRYALCLAACGDERTETVQSRLVPTFRRYGLPDAFLVDNGSPWGDGPGQSWTRLGVWLLKLGIDVIHSRPYHPQTRGKNERFHRTLKAELLALRRFRDLRQAQAGFDAWRRLYNCERPHEALGFDVPASRYRVSARAMPERLPQPEYQTGDILRRVGTTRTYVSFKGRWWKVPQAFAGERVALRPLDRDGRYGVFFASRQIATLDLSSNAPHHR